MISCNLRSDAEEVSTTHQCPQCYRAENIACVAWTPGFWHAASPQPPDPKQRPKSNKHCTLGVQITSISFFEHHVMRRGARQLGAQAVQRKCVMQAEVTNHTNASLQVCLHCTATPGMCCSLLVTTVAWSLLGLLLLIVLAESAARAQHLEVKGNTGEYRKKEQAALVFERREQKGTLLCVLCAVPAASANILHLQSVSCLVCSVFVLLSVAVCLRAPHPPTVGCSCTWWLPSVSATAEQSSEHGAVSQPLCAYLSLCCASSGVVGTQDRAQP